MPHGYCIECSARVTVVDGACLLGHRIDPNTISTKRGRRIAAVDQVHETGAVAVLERPVLPRIELPPVPKPSISRPALARANLSLSDLTKTREPRPAKERPGGDRPSTRPALDRLPLPLDDDLNPTGEFVLQLWDTTEDAPPLEGWQSDDPLAAMPERDPKRWVSFGLIGAAGFAVVMAIGLVLGQVGSATDALISRSQALLTEVSAFDASSQDPDFAALDMAAREVLAAAEQLETGDPQRALAIDAAGEALGVQRALGEALSYQTGFVVFAGRPSLPVAATEAEISEVSVTFTAWATELTNVLASAPSGRAFTEHTELIDAFELRLPEHQAGYFDALRSGSPQGARSRLDAIDADVAELERTLAASMTATQLSSMATLDEVADMLGRIAGLEG